jgi:flagellar assembly factor FliW
MLIQSKALGPVEIEEKQHITFPVGLFGFDQYHEYAVLDAEQRPFYWLQSLDKVEIAFILINPYLIRPDYVLEIPDDDFDDIGGPEPDDILVFAVVTIPERMEEMTANLQGPIIVNRQAQLGRQSIHLDSRWKTKHSILGELSTRRTG